MKLLKNNLVIIVAILVGLIVITIGVIKDGVKPITVPQYQTGNITIVNYLKNKPEYSYLVYLGLKKLDIDSVTVILRPYDVDTYMFNGIEYHIDAKISKRNNFYYIDFNDIDRSKVIEIISHELIHLHQYHSKKLIIDNKNVYWEQQKFKLDRKYEDLPWEIEANFLGRKLKQEIEKEIWK